MRLAREIATLILALLLGGVLLQNASANVLWGYWEVGPQVSRPTPTEIPTGTSTATTTATATSTATSTRTATPTPGCTANGSCPNCINVGHGNCNNACLDFCPFESTPLANCTDDGTTCSCTCVN